MACITAPSNLIFIQPQKIGIIICIPEVRQLRARMSNNLSKVIGSLTFKQFFFSFSKSNILSSIQCCLTIITWAKQKKRRKGGRKEGKKEDAESSCSNIYYPLDSFTCHSIRSSRAQRKTELIYTYKYKIHMYIYVCMYIHICMCVYIYVFYTQEN